MPDHIKALSAAYSWFSANEVYFQGEDEEHPLNHERYGWIRDDRGHGPCICFIPDKLCKHLNTEIGPNTYEAATDEWKNLGILIPKIQNSFKIKKNQISTSGGKKQVIKIPFAKFEEYLKLEKDEENSNFDKKPEDNNQSSTSTKSTQETSKVKVTTSINDFEKIANSTFQTDSVDEDAIIDSDDAALAELMIQEGFNDYSVS
jgi:hypothetical protein